MVDFSEKEHILSWDYIQPVFEAFWLYTVPYIFNYEPDTNRFVLLYNADDLSDSDRRDFYDLLMQYPDGFDNESEVYTVAFFEIHENTNYEYGLRDCVDIGRYEYAVAPEDQDKYYGGCTQVIQKFYELLNMWEEQED